MASTAASPLAVSIARAPSSATVSARAISYNTARMRALCQTPVMAVVKADGFGLGAAAVARAALAGGASELGVATCDEALALRDEGITAPILAWMLHPGAAVAQALAADVALSCASVDQLAVVIAGAVDAGATAVVELECDTGMHRSGSSRDEWPALCRAAFDAEREGRIAVRGIWTHLAATDDDAAAFAPALARFDAAARIAGEAGLRPRRRHAASSLPATVAPAARLDLVRLGASLFGIEPVPRRPVGLAQVTRWETNVTQVREVAAGDAVGYGAGYRAARPGRLALLPLGYADGIPRSAWPGITVSIGGERHPLVGAVSMDQCVVDAGRADVSVGDPVVLIGDPTLGEPSLAEWARLLDTIPQEVLTRLGSRVARIVDEGAAE